MSETRKNLYIIMPNSRAFDVHKFSSEFRSAFKGRGLDADAASNAVRMLNKMVSDARITDKRQMAYMLATAHWETRVRHKVVVVKDGKPKTKYLYSAFTPVGELDKGRGRLYSLTVKVKALGDGTARVTEQDGDQFIVKKDGSYSSLTKGAHADNSGKKRDYIINGAFKICETYKDDDGAEHAYYGRGLVQLTWWYNYAKQGFQIGRGLDLLFDPESAEDYDVAYSLMAQGMTTGSGFANGKRMSQFFTATHTDYVGARAIVNGRDHNAEIAEIAQQYEQILATSEVHVSEPRPMKEASLPLRLP
ncbi:glycoside hydrolase [Xanthobacter oligotrophicus]|uniref:glycoside hydrolase n=1 Tax=Xanthobacter oligotrophicus TaxID=2607286 RepID=UPI00165E8B6D|nr:glycoside hydrolase [Xanthobacter oligotrophicus]MCG5233966.1 hypothetical protein [Xanthobacter oligotrophicus]